MSRSTSATLLTFDKSKASARGLQVKTTCKSKVTIDSPYPDDATMAAIRKVRAPTLKKITQSPF